MVPTVSYYGYSQPPSTIERRGAPDEFLHCLLPSATATQLSLDLAHHRKKSPADIIPALCIF